MARDVESLVVSLSMKLDSYMRELQKAQGITNKQARAIEARWRQANKNLDGIGRNMARGVMADDARTNGPISRSMVARARGFGGR